MAAPTSTEIKEAFDALIEAQYAVNEHSARCGKTACEVCAAFYAAYAKARDKYRERIKEMIG